MKWLKDNPKYREKLVDVGVVFKKNCSREAYDQGG